MASPLKRKLAQLDKAIAAAQEGGKNATGEYGYWSFEIQLRKLDEERYTLLKEAIDLLYEKFGYVTVATRLNKLKALDDAKKALKDAEREV